MSYASLPHLRSNAASIAAAPAPVVAVGAGAGAGATASLTRGSDEAGTVSVTTAGTPAAGVLATVTFANAYQITPAAVNIDAGDVNSAKVQLFASVSNTVLTISAATAPTAGQTFTLFYAVIGGA